MKRRNEALLLTIALAVALPSVRVGFHFDDWWQLIVARAAPFGQAVTGMFVFVGRGAAPVPVWWADPDLKLAFFRPLSSLLVLADDRLFGDRVALWHLHQIAWWVLLVLLVRGVHKAALPRRAGVVSVAVFALDEAHLFPIAWLANRNALVSAVFGLVALIAHARWRRDGDRRFVAGEVAAWALAFAGGEGALSMVPYVIAWEALAAMDDRATRARALLPAGAVFAAWAIVYKGLGYGTAGSGSYHDPLDDPFGWAWDAPSRLFAALGQLLGRAPVDTWFVAPSLWWWPILVGVLCVPVWAWLLRTFARLEPARWYGVRWLLAGAFLSLLPVLSTFPSSRLLLAPSIGTAAVIGALIDHVWRTRASPDAPPRAYRVVVSLMALGAFVVAPLSLAVQIEVLRQYARDFEQNALRADLGRADQISVVLYAPDATMVAYQPAVHYLAGRTPHPWAVLSMAPCRHVLHRVSDTALELELVDGHMMGTEWEKLFRRRPLRAGDVIPWGDATVEVLEADAVGPTRLRLSAARSLDDPRVAWLTYTDGRFAPTALPRVGEQLVIEPLMR